MDHNKVVLEQLQVAEEATQARQHRARVERSGRALCLSGGGFRAALFHLGALLRLHQTGQLSAVTLFSSVSGGSIISAWLACRFLATRNDPEETFADWCARIDFRQVVVEPFRGVVADDIRTGPVLSTLPWSWLFPSGRVKKLERAYARIYGAVALHDLPDRPRFVICATDLTFGVNWVFSKRRIGDYLAGYLRKPGPMPLARAVAASSCFPPVFGPVRLKAKAVDFHRGKYSGADADLLRSRIDLSDGGVYDNLATEPTLRRYGEVLISDAGAPFQFQTRRWFFKQLMRYTQVVGNQAQALRKRIYFKLRTDDTIEGAYWGLAGARLKANANSPGYSQALIVEVIGRVRTDLDRFLQDEFSVLVNHGYFACANSMQREEQWQSDVPADWPYPELADEARVRRVMRFSHRRFFHNRWWRR
ncbi:MAG: patatin-like phospholipase family protein [Pseudomonadota bacterium]|nr:patatin-like phospholipase family protein [Pseudomonadota bacterium]